MEHPGQFEEAQPADPRWFCPERNFLAGGAHRRFVEWRGEPDFERSAARDGLKQAAAEWPGFVVMFRAADGTADGDLTTGIQYIDWPATDLEDYGSCAAIAAGLPAAAPLLLIIADVIQRLTDPRPLLAMAREALLAHPGGKCLISTPDRAVLGEPDPSAVRLWTADEFGRAMQAAGFSARLLPPGAADAPAGMMMWEIGCESGAYLHWLGRSGLPAPAARLVLDPPQDDPAATGALTLVTGQAPNAPAGSLPLSVFGAAEGPDAVLAAVQQILFIYPGIELIELGDTHGVGYRVAQARRAGMLPPRTRVVTHARENSFTLNAALRAFNRDRPVRLAVMERLSIELADMAVFADAQKHALYVEAGGMAPRAAYVGQGPGWLEVLDAMPDPAPGEPGGVTVLMTSFRADPEHLHDAARGLRQAFRQPDRLIFVDDHSGEEDGASFEPFPASALADVPMEILRLPENLGPAGARNAGLARVTTAYVCGHDHDNIMLNRFLAVACRILDANPDVAAVTSWMGFFEDGGAWRTMPETARDYRPIGADLGVALTDNIVGDHFALYRTSVLREVGGWDGTGRAVWEDWQLFCRLMAGGYTVWTVPDALILYRLRDDSRNATQSHFEGWLSLSRALPGLPRGQAISVLQAAWHMPPAAAVPAALAPASPILLDMSAPFEPTEREVAREVAAPSAPIEPDMPEPSEPMAPAAAEAPDGRVAALEAELAHLRTETAALQAIAASTAWRRLRWLLERLERFPAVLALLRRIAGRRPRVAAAEGGDAAPAPADPLPTGPPPAPVAAFEAAPAAPRIAGLPPAPESLRALAWALRPPVKAPVRPPGGLASAAPEWRPRISVIVPTDRRPASLDDLLTCLRYQDGPEFEVIVIAGPSGMGTSDVLEKWSGAVKVAHTAALNTSQSRNLGIAMAAGDIIALIDDDALPEADWLEKLTADFADPAVGAVGGAEYDHTGTVCQLPYISVDRLGEMDMSWTAPVEAFNFPLSYHVPFTPGVNSAFRHAALRALGGFDEEYEYYFDETDLCCRLLDAGWQLRQVPDAVVHHKTLASHIRSEARIYHNLYTLLKGKLYFSLVNNHGHYPTARAVEDMQAYVAMQEAILQSHVAAGRLDAAVLERFAEDAKRAWRIGMERGVAKQRRLAGWAGQPARESLFLPFARPRPAGGRAAILLVGLTPDEDGFLQRRARAAAAAGHHVHAVLPGEEHDRVDFESGVWVYRFLTPLAAVRRIIGRWRLDVLDVAKGESTDTWVETWAASLALELGRPLAPQSPPGWLSLALNGVTGISIAAE